MKIKIILSIIVYHFLAMILLVVTSSFGLAKNISDPLSETIIFLYHPYYWGMAYFIPVICSPIFLWIFILLIVLILGVRTILKKSKLNFILFNIGLFFLFSFPIIIYWITGIIKYCGE